MNSQEEAVAPPEIVIVRRRAGGEDEGHHGSAWKIAYADFVTAMMAFFLVMWLINSSDKQTVTQVAAYFNPIKLSSKNPSSKGIEEAATAKGIKTPEEEVEVQLSKASSAKTGMGKERHDQQLAASEQEMFADPFQALNKIALLEDPAVPPTPQERNGDDASDRSKTSEKPKELDVKKVLEDPIVVSADQVEDTADAKVEKKSGKLEDLKAKLEEKVRKALATLSPREKPLLQFKKVEEGVLITLTDQFDFSMFRIGSAKPRAQLIKAIEAIAESLKDTPGDVVIRGHTDATPYATKHYDNWRLSTARAQMARYMLLRGGLEEKRIARIEGYGSRSLRIKTHPTAAENRRIEILLRN